MNGGGRRRMDSEDPAPSRDDFDKIIWHATLRLRNRLRSLLVTGVPPHPRETVPPAGSGETFAIKDKFPPINHPAPSGVTYAVGGPENHYRDSICVASEELIRWSYAEAAAAFMPLSKRLILIQQPKVVFARASGLAKGRGRVWHFATQSQ